MVCQHGASPTDHLQLGLEILSSYTTKDQRLVNKGSQHLHSTQVKSARCKVGATDMTDRQKAALTTVAPQTGLARRIGQIGDKYSLRHISLVWVVALGSTRQAQVVCLLYIARRIAVHTYRAVGCSIEVQQLGTDHTRLLQTHGTILSGYLLNKTTHTKRACTHSRWQHARDLQPATASASSSADFPLQ